MWGTYCFCEASRDELGSNSRKFWLGWVPAAHHSSQPVLHICESCLNTRSSILESRGHPLPLQSEGLPRAILPFSWGRACCPGCASWHRLVGHSLLWAPLLLLALLPDFSAQHKCPQARVTYALWGAAGPALSSLLTPHGGTMKPTIMVFCFPTEFC